MGGTRFLQLLCFLCFQPFCAFSQSIEQERNRQQLDSIMRFLTDEKLDGRQNFTPNLFIAAEFINQYFAKIGLLPWPPLVSMCHLFTIQEKQNLADEAEDGKINPKKYLCNVVAYLPGDSLPKEFILISAHLDHMGDGLLGANDNASGVATMMVLAKHFAEQEKNKRSILFCAFSGEELGLYGSTTFVQNFDISAIKAMINLEMLGFPNGSKEIQITGWGQSPLPALLAKNAKMQDASYRFSACMYPDLFLRSDNLPFHKALVPAHTLMGSTDRADPCYHAKCDTFEHISIDLMANRLAAIKLAIEPLIQGQLVEWEKKKKKKRKR